MAVIMGRPDGLDQAWAVCALTHGPGRQSWVRWRHRLDNSEHGTTVLFVTHNVEMSKRCDRIIEVIDGLVTA